MTSASTLRRARRSLCSTWLTMSSSNCLTGTKTNNSSGEPTDGRALDALGTFPARDRIAAWLQAGVVEREQFTPRLQTVQSHVQQQRADHPALRSSFLGRCCSAPRRGGTHPRVELHRRPPRTRGRGHRTTRARGRCQWGLNLPCHQCPAAESHRSRHILPAAPAGAVVGPPSTRHMTSAIGLAGLVAAPVCRECQPAAIASDSLAPGRKARAMVGADQLGPRSHRFQGPAAIRHGVRRRTGAICKDCEDDPNTL